MNEEWMKTWKVARVASVAALFGAASSMSGCFVTDPNGFEFSATLGGHAVSTYHQESTTDRRSCGGVMGWLKGCPTQMPTEEHGS